MVVHSIKVLKRMCVHMWIQKFWIDICLCLCYSPKWGLKDQTSVQTQLFLSRVFHLICGLNPVLICLPNPELAMYFTGEENCGFCVSRRDLWEVSNYSWIRTSFSPEVMIVGLRTIDVTNWLKHLLFVYTSPVVVHTFWTVSHAILNILRTTYNILRSIIGLIIRNLIDRVKWKRRFAATSNVAFGKKLNLL